MSVLLRECTLADVGALQQISRETFTDTFGDANQQADLDRYLTKAYNTDQLTKELSDPESAFFFIYMDDQLAGYLKVNFGNNQTEQYGTDKLEVQRIYIRPSFKHLGLGTHLMNKAFEIARRVSKHRIWLGVWEHNESAKKFYQKLGFVQVGEHVFTLGSSRQRDLIMAKDI
ncbi:GNAT family N-acetyltransferase [Lentilactobacillus farraginis]|uniref:Acetyltransferase, GNAT family n=1 Tax=Lentilactobacillus farraginis DSM 18382 = JCM 14108 TaxID=1423743 RepID=X0PB37_9LACO|nr:GNAT family N-acetyltransferase [Lentilactobacillus farraginis]KRM06364.1 spermine spermidine N-acetyltransferase [Lentilactobacillus farraginis DSM 18382 = JCM 14108]GAF36898.1 acetyltransferase, GNAT family [Lentilactobacillus farraginis DSM 18382 = JCM 14108]